MKNPKARGSREDKRGKSAKPQENLAGWNQNNTNFDSPQGGEGQDGARSIGMSFDMNIFDRLKLTTLVHPDQFG